MTTSRRAFLSTTSVALAAPALAAGPAAAPSDPRSLFKFCLNPSTVRGQNLTVMQQIDLAAKAGYDAIEPWIGDIDNPRKSGGSLSDIGKKLKDTGLAVPSAIGFAQWAHDDDAARAKGLEQMKREMSMIREIGGTRIAACASGINKGPKVDLDVLAERYRAVCELGRSIGVVPELELWGPSVNLSKLHECLYIAAASKHEDACLLLDVYHLHKGNNSPASLHLLGPGAVHVMHMNDYPADVPLDTITDGHRVYPGDGAAPYRQIFQTLARNGVSLYLSLELFNKDYWKQDPMTVAKTGLEKSKAAVAQALG